MEEVIANLRRWISRHYPNAENANLMQQILQIYAEPVTRALHSIQTSSEWMEQDLRRLMQAMREPWVEIIDPPPRTLTAQQMEDRLRSAVRRTHDIWKQQMDEWIAQYGDDEDPFEVEESDVRVLRRMADVLSDLKTLKSPESVRRKMDTVINAAVGRRQRVQQRQQQEIARRMQRLRQEAEDNQRERDARAAAARLHGLSLGRGQRSRDPVEHGMLARRR